MILNQGEHYFSGEWFFELQPNANLADQLTQHRQAAQQMGMILAHAERLVILGEEAFWEELELSLEILTHCKGSAAGKSDWQ